MPDSLPIKYAFCGIRSTWFLHVEASYVQNLCVSRLPHTAAATLPKSQDFINCNAEEEKENTIHISKKKKKKKQRKKYNEKYMQNTASAILEGCSCRFEENPSDTNNKSQFVVPENEVQNLVKLNPHSNQGSPSEMSTEVISVTGIINKYFPTLNGVDNFGSPSLSDGTSKAVHKEIEDQPKTPETPPNNSHAPLHVSLVSETSRDKRSESKLRKRLLVASQSLGISTVKCSPTVSLCRFKDGNLIQHSSRTQGSLFEISDSDD